LCDRGFARSTKIAPVAIRNVPYPKRSSMNVTSPATQHTTQATSHTLPIKRGTETPTVETGTPAAKTPASNPAHLGNHVDTTA
jgi:hypothetical protein